MRHPDVDGWRIETELFTSTDGEKFYRVKKAKNDFMFDMPDTSYVLWQSKPSPRHRKEFQTRQEALDWALIEIKKGR